MKKRVMSMLMVMIMMVSMLSVSVFAADHSAHAGDIGTAWVSDEVGHWYECTNADCVAAGDVQSDYAVHTFDTNHKCTVCGYQGTHAWVDNGTEALCKCGASHTHALTWVNTDATNHWKVCSECPVDAAKKYNEAAHNWVKDDAASTETLEAFKCECGATKTAHVHAWATTASYDATNHWYACNDTTCTEVNGLAAHTMVQNGTVSACSVCGYSEHVHVWATTVTTDANYHWYACTDASCTEVKGKEMHYDHNSSYTCDVCSTNIPVQTLTSLTVTGASEPSEGVTVDFSVNVAEDRFGTPVVKWNRVVDLSKNTSVALGDGAKYAAGKMYNTSILVPMNSRDKISDDIKITLNGVTVPYYTTDAAFQNAIKAFEGRYTTYAAKAMWTNDYLCICISVQYPTTAGTHTHDFGKGWLATPAKHYLKCVACGEVPEAEYHADVDKSGFCDVCDYNMNYYNPNAPTYPDGTTAGSGTGTAAHTHTYSADWVEDISNHWKQCTGCGAVTQKAAHADLNNTGKCDVCGFVMKAEAGHTHSFATEWTETFAQHYKVCSCGAKNEIAAHVDLNNTGKCDTCGYAMTTLSNNGIVADTGDDNATFLWMAAFAVSVLGAGATILFARKKREE